MTAFALPVLIDRVKKRVVAVGSLQAEPGEKFPQLRAAWDAMVKHVRGMQ